MPQGQIIRQAFENALDALGESGRRALIEDLLNNGVFLNDPEINLIKIMTVLRNLLGDEVADTMAERIIIKLDEMYSVQK
ncbi:MAG: hypothetical protein AUJ08_03360 [Thaumarchaeota archaeon 13_1_40CM_3_50_5]|nr:MAG: hypothetical protein AUJ08_03360 [Thaumarchaeota archaeon 13_1_40CM_3_50_5]